MGPCARLRICKSERNKHAGSCHYSLEPLMPDTSHALSLPLIQPSQAQKHVTHNEALRILDAVVQLVVIAADQSGPPTAPQSGDRYIVAPSGVGAWLGHDGDIASNCISTLSASSFDPNVVSSREMPVSASNDIRLHIVTPGQNLDFTRRCQRITGLQDHGSSEPCYGKFQYCAAIKCHGVPQCKSQAKNGPRARQPPDCNAQIPDL